MTESNPSKRGLEEISHLFLSSAGPKDTRPGSRPAKARLEKAAPEPTDPGPPAESQPVGLMAAVEADALQVTTPALLQAAKTYLKRSDLYKDAVPVENIESRYYGMSDLVLVDRRRGRIACARMARDQDSAGFLVSSLAYYDWLRQCIHVGALFFDADPTLDMYVFADNFSSSISSLADRWTDRDRVHLVTYKVWRVEGLKRPVVHFRPVRQSRASRKKGNLRCDPRGLPPADPPAGYPDPFDITHAQWRAFERLKHDAFS
ncbi:MAG: hypothetical protein JRI36_00585 [Deltaproteobacteria bacterium]|nr:hypothetical protein [Deltaproteobacteria bacterium]